MFQYFVCGTISAVESATIGILNRREREKREQKRHMTEIFQFWWKSFTHLLCLVSVVNLAKSRIIWRRCPWVFPCGIILAILTEVGKHINLKRIRSIPWLRSWTVWAPACTCCSLLPYCRCDTHSLLSASPSWAWRGQLLQVLALLTSLPLPFLNQAILPGYFITATGKWAKTSHSSCQRSSVTCGEHHRNPQLVRRQRANGHWVPNPKWSIYNTAPLPTA